MDPILTASNVTCDEHVPVDVGKAPYVRFDLNDYSVPHTHVRRQLAVVADLHTVRVVDGVELVAAHTRTWGRGERVEDPAHVAALVEEKREAHKHRGMDRLQHAAPRSHDFLMRCAERGQNLGSITYQLGRLLDQYGAADLDGALAEANTRGLVHPPSVRQLLEQRRQAHGRPAPLSPVVPVGSSPSTGSCARLQDIEDPGQRLDLDPAAHAKQRATDDQLDLAGVRLGRDRKWLRDLHERRRRAPGLPQPRAQVRALVGAHDGNPGVASSPTR